MKIKTGELIDTPLDWAVAKCAQYDWWWAAQEPRDGLFVDHDRTKRYSPSTDREQGGLIIEKEGINVRAIRKEGHSLHGQWLAAYDHGNTGTMVQWVKRTDFPRHYFSGPTLLIAAMRCYVASKLGEEVDIPEELL